MHRIKRRRVPVALAIFCAAALATSFQASCLFPHGQRYQDFSVPRPVPSGQWLILGFVGGRQAWDNPNQGVRQLALRLRQMDLPAHIETVENQKRGLALRLVREFFDTNADGTLCEHEKRRARLALYGQSFGGAAVLKFSRQMQGLGIPVQLTVQIDSVGRGDRRVPPNVSRAANLYQSNGILIKGQAAVTAEDPSRTEILGNFQFDYSGRKIDLSGVRWYQKILRVAHAKMGQDPEVWELVERLILDEIHRVRNLEALG